MFVAPAAAQPARRLKDVNTGGSTSGPERLQASESRLYFVASNGPTDGLWVSDGSADGTVLVPGTSGAMRPMPMGDRAFFMRNFSDLWVSDGTSAGTLLLKANAQTPTEWVVSSGKLYFAASGGELWMSDGTPAGTQRVKEPDPGTGPLGCQHLATVGARVYFIAFKGGVNALWTTDGTSAGTRAIQGSPVAVGSVTDPPIAALGSTVFFGGTDPTRGLELWVSDGTDTGTTLFADLNPGSASSYPSQLVVSGGLLYFTAFTSGVGWRLWVSNGTPAGTGPLDAGGAFSDAGDFKQLADAGGKLVYRTEVQYGTWTSDGTNAGTILVRPDVSQDLTAVGSRAFFTVGSQLWVTDLTPAGTHHVRSFSSVFSGPGAAFAGRLFLAADDGIHGRQLWASDGTAAGTTLAAILRPGPNGSYPGSFVELSGAAFFFAASSGAFSPTDVWRTDGTGAGTARVVQTGAGAFSGMAATSRKLFWLEGSIGPAGPCGVCPGPWLVASDGTQAGTAPVPGPSGPVVYAIGAPVAALEKVFLMGTDVLASSPPFFLWRADGTASALSLGPFPNGSFGPLVALHDRVVFLVKPLAGATEAWASDGTPAGTSRLKALSTRFTPSCSGVPARLGRQLLFFADDDSTGCNVWATDGTEAGTVPVGLVGGGASADVTSLGTARGFLVFANGKEVWRTDGTAVGTLLLKTVEQNLQSVVSGARTREGVYFAVQAILLQDAVEQLWLTNGTVAGTVLLHDFKANGENARIDRLTTANGRLLMSVADGVTGALSLWTSDGTPGGTFPVQQDVGASGTGFPYRGGTLFTGTDPWAGQEPWVIDGSVFFAPVPPTSLSLVPPCRILDTRGPNGFLGGPALLANGPRVFPVGDVCGIPWTARALAANVTVTGATADGLLNIHPSDIGAPDASTINFRAGQTRANNATLALSGDAEFTVRYETPTGAGQVHVIVDVVGWYE